MVQLNVLQFAELLNEYLPLLLKKVAQKTSGGEKSPKMFTRSLKEAKLIRRRRIQTSLPSWIKMHSILISVLSFTFPGGDFPNAGYPTLYPIV